MGISEDMGTGVGEGMVLVLHVEQTEDRVHTVQIQEKMILKMTPQAMIQMTRSQTPSTLPMGQIFQSHLILILALALALTQCLLAPTTRRQKPKNCMQLLIPFSQLPSSLSWLLNVPLLSPSCLSHLLQMTEADQSVSANQQNSWTGHLQHSLCNEQEDG